MCKHMKTLAHELPRVYRDTIELASRLSEHADTSGDPEHLRVRSTEFLLLLTKLSRIDGLRHNKILEVGCGRGLGLLLWSQVAEHVAGIDLPEEIQRAKHFLQGSSGQNIRLFSSRGEDLLTELSGFDLVISQYVLEHVDDIGAVLDNTKRYVAQDGYVVHILNNLSDRLDWYLTYRLQTSPLRRLVHSKRHRGWLETMKRPLHFTVPHEPRFGSFRDELSGYRLEEWSRIVMQHGFMVVDYFQTREVNWALVTRPLAP